MGLAAAVAGLALAVPSALGATQVVNKVVYGGSADAPTGYGGAALNSWKVLTDNDASPFNGYQFAYGPLGQPLGQGSIELQNGPGNPSAGTGSKVYLVGPDLTNTPLANVNALSYYTYQNVNENQTTSKAPAYVNVPIDPKSSDSSQKFTTLNYAPGLGSNPNVKPYTWTQYDAAGDNTARCTRPGRSRFRR